jgi:hypothetical protein
MGAATVETGGSVSTTALDILIRMGAEPVVLVGLDLAFPGDRLHAGGTFYGDFQAGLAGGELVANNKGGLVATSKILNIYRRWVEKRISRENKTFINTSLEGARIAGTVVCHPEYLTGLVCGGKINEQ